MLAFLRRSNSEISSIKDALEQVLKVVGEQNATKDDSDSTSTLLQDLRLRVENLELSNEQLREECLRHLRKASQRLKRAEEIAEDDQLEETTPAAVPNLEIPFEDQAEQDDMTWARNQIRNRGETPV